MGKSATHPAGGQSMLLNDWERASRARYRCQRSGCRGQWWRCSRTKTRCSFWTRPETFSSAASTACREENPAWVLVSNVSRFSYVCKTASTKHFYWASEKTNIRKN